MNFQAGKAVGALGAFLNIPQETRKEFSAAFATAWRLGGCEKPKPNQSYTDFMSGVFDEGSGGRLITSDDDETVKDTRNEDRECSDSASDDLVRSGSLRCVAAANDQDLVDAQLHSELSSTLCEPAAILQGGTTADSNQPQMSANPSISLNGIGAKGIQSSRGREITRPGSSRPFVFKRPTAPEGPTNWEEVRSGEISPIVTGQSTLDTFTAELLAKAEQCSTVGSVCRQPSTTREASEAVLAIRSGETCGRHKIRLRKTAPTGDLIILDLSSEDDNSNNEIQDLGFEIIGFRAIDNTKGPLVRKKRRGVLGTSPVRLD